MVSGTPTEVFAQVARGVLGCWLAADGPLKASHVYRAEADPPAKGGAAAIIIYERDASQQDGRGSLAYRASLSGEGSGVRVTMRAMKFELKLAQAMARDVEAWAKGGESCQLRASMPRPAPPAPAKAAAKPVKGSGSSKKP
jgi:hypothetical protein